MLMLVVMAFLFYCFHAAVEAIDGTPGTLMRMALELNSGMTNTVFLIEHSGQRLQNGRTSTGGQIVNEGMT